MTENKRMSISGLLDVLDTGISLSTCHIEYAIQSDILEDLVCCLEELEQYRAIGTIEELQELKEKNTPEKPLFVPTDDTCLYHEYRCPSCNEWLSDKFKPYRCKCGKLLDWQ